jgi:hypothetical protein
MLKLGIWRLDQHPAVGRAPLAWLRSNHVDYRLLRTSQPPSASAIAVFEDIMRDLRLSSGVFRTTEAGRFRALDAWVTPILQAHFPSETPLVVFDWAVSDAITSVAWHNEVIRANPNLRFTASDLHLYLLEMQVPDGGSFILESFGAALQYVRPPWVIRLDPPEPAWLIVNSALARRARESLVALEEQHHIDPSRIEFPEGVETVHSGPVRFAKIPFLHPEALALSHTASSFRIVRHSVFEPTAERAQVVRTMNIFNPVYFDRPRLELGAQSVWHSLVTGGLWIVGRTVDSATGQHRLSILRKTVDRFELECRFDESSEIEDIALAVRP